MEFYYGNVAWLFTPDFKKLVALLKPAELGPALKGPGVKKGPAEKGPIRYRGVLKMYDF